MTNLTISLDEHIIRLARVRAVQEGTSVSAKVREFLARYAHQVDEPVSPVAPVTLPVYDGQSGLRPGIDPSSNRSMLDAADTADFPHPPK